MMASSSHSYSSPPALPTLAHSLLPQSHQLHETTLGTWDLKDDVYKAFTHCADSVFRKGTVIGLSRLRNQSRDHDDDDNEFIGQVSRSILTAQLCKISPSPVSIPRAYIIHPANLDIFSPQKLLQSLLCESQKPVLSRDEAISRLDSVQLFPVFDLAAAVQAIGDVSDTLYRYQVERQPQQPCKTHFTENDGCPVFLVIAGLDTLTEGVIRASSMVRGTAALSSVLRTLTQLSRIHSSFLSVILVNSSGLGTMTSDTHVISGSGQIQQWRNQGYNPQTSRENGIYSIFHASKTLLCPSLLMRTLEQGIDTHFLLSTVKSTYLVEIIKDRVGGGLGRWCIWDKRNA